MELGYSIVPELEILNVNRPSNTKCSPSTSITAIFVGGVSLLQLRPKFSVTGMNYCNGFQFGNLAFIFLSCRLFQVTSRSITVEKSWGVEKRRSSFCIVLQKPFWMVFMVESHEISKIVVALFNVMRAKTYSWKSNTAKDSHF